MTNAKHCQPSDQLPDQDVVPNKANEPQDVDSANFSRRLRERVAAVFRERACDCHCNACCKISADKAISEILSVLQEMELPKSAIIAADYATCANAADGYQIEFRAIISELSRLHKEGGHNA